MRAVELPWNLQVRSRQPHPFRAHIVHMRKDRRNGADLARRLRSPRSRIKLLQKHLVHALIAARSAPQPDSVACQPCEAWPCRSLLHPAQLQDSRAMTSSKDRTPNCHQSGKISRIQYRRKAPLSQSRFLVILNVTEGE